jgi:DNA replication and repair protein RecF
MYLKNISLRNLRNYQSLELGLGPGLNLFFGDNAQGKTNLLEAVALLASLRSFRGVKGSAAVAWGEKECVIRGETEALREGGSVRARRMQLSIEKGGRRVTLDGKKPGGPAEYLLTLRVSCFSPEDLFLVREYPASRRRFLDRSIFYLQPGYLDIARDCGNAVKQLSSSLKAGDRKVAESWEEVLAPLAAEVCWRRRRKVDELGPLAAEMFSEIFGVGGLGFAYKTQAKGDSVAELAESFRSLFEKKRAEGMKRGHCLAGPHMDDLSITLSGHEMRSTASRGQGRLALLALVLADAESYKAERGEYPVLLLDDAASELDDRRKEALMRHVSGMGQVILTSTDAGLISGLDGLRYRVGSTEEGAKAERV